MEHGCYKEIHLGLALAAISEKPLFVNKTLLSSTAILAFISGSLQNCYDWIRKKQEYGKCITLPGMQPSLSKFLPFFDIFNLAHNKPIQAQRNFARSLCCTARIAGLLDFEKVLCRITSANEKGDIAAANFWRVRKIREAKSRRIKGSLVHQEQSATNL